MSLGLATLIAQPVVATFQVDRAGQRLADAFDVAAAIARIDADLLNQRIVSCRKMRAFGHRCWSALAQPSCRQTSHATASASQRQFQTLTQASQDFFVEQFIGFIWFILRALLSGMMITSRDQHALALLSPFFSRSLERAELAGCVPCRADQARAVARREFGQAARDHRIKQRHVRTIGDRRPGFGGADDAHLQLKVPANLLTITEAAVLDILRR